jgi:predicted lipoprotein with Yx(FWY)xxD motif
MSLYLFVSDTATKSTCAGTCLTYWPPLEASGSVTTGPGVDKAKLGTLTGTNGRKQVSYAGHPLYFYAGDSKPGDTTGQGSNQSGAKWWLLTPSGTAITRTAPLAPPSSSAP